MGRPVQLLLHCVLAGVILGLATCIAALVYHPYAVAGLLILGGLLGLIHTPLLWLFLKAKPLLISTATVFATAVAFTSLATALGLRRLPLLGVAIVSIWFGIGIAKIYVRDIPIIGYCVECNYNLTANTSGICPECGTSIPENQRELISKAGSGQGT